MSKSKSDATIPVQAAIDYVDGQMSLVDFIAKYGTKKYQLVDNLQTQGVLTPTVDALKVTAKSIQPELELMMSSIVVPNKPIEGAIKEICEKCEEYIATLPEESPLKHTTSIINQNIKSTLNASTNGSKPNSRANKQKKAQFRFSGGFVESSIRIVSFFVGMGVLGASPVLAPTLGLTAAILGGVLCLPVKAVAITGEINDVNCSKFAMIAGLSTASCVISVGHVAMDIASGQTPGGKPRRRLNTKKRRRLRRKQRTRR